MSLQLQMSRLARCIDGLTGNGIMDRLKKFYAMNKYLGEFFRACVTFDI